MHLTLTLLYVMYRWVILLYYQLICSLSFATAVICHFLEKIELSSWWKKKTSPWHCLVLTENVEQLKTEVASFRKSLPHPDHTDIKISQDDGVVRQVSGRSALDLNVSFSVQWWVALSSSIYTLQEIHIFAYFLSCTKQMSMLPIMSNYSFKLYISGSFIYIMCQGFD